MSHSDEVEFGRLKERLRAVEQDFERGMRARGFDPAQDENLALTSSLAKLYEQRDELRTQVAALAGNDKPAISEDDKTMNDLASRDCVPCRGGVPPMKGEELIKLQSEIEGWEIVNEHHLRKEYRFKDFKETQEFIDRVGHLAEEQWHHPDICFGWGRAEITIWTHKIDGLTESDFILAAKIDALLGSNGSAS